MKYKECRNIVVQQLKAAIKNLNVNLQQILRVIANLFFQIRTFEDQIKGKS